MRAATFGSAAARRGGCPPDRGVCTSADAERATTNRNKRFAVSFPLSRPEYIFGSPARDIDCTPHIGLADPCFTCRPPESGNMRTEMSNLGKMGRENFWREEVQT